MPKIRFCGRTTGEMQNGRLCDGRTDDRKYEANFLQHNTITKLEIMSTYIVEGMAKQMQKEREKKIRHTNIKKNTNANMNPNNNL